MSIGLVGMGTVVRHAAKLSMARGKDQRRTSFHILSMVTVNDEPSYV